MFNINDYIMYGNSGVCKVADICTPKIFGADNKRKYYLLHPVYREEDTIYTPVDNTQVAMRKVISKNEANQLIIKMPTIGTITIGANEKRERIYKAALNSCDNTEWIKLIKTVHYSKKEKAEMGKKICETEKLAQRIAEDLLYGELSISLQIPKDQVEKYITNKIELSDVI